MNNPDTTDLKHTVQNENTSPPNNEAVLGGIEGVKHRLNSDNVEVVIAALKEAVNYQDEGLDLVITALQERLLKKHESGENILTTEQYYQLVAENRNTQDFTGLVGLDLTQVEFRNKNFELSRPNLTQTTIIGSKISNIYLQGVNLTEATLIDVGFDHVNLTGANLSNLNLNAVSFRSSVLQGVDFSNSSLRGANLGNANVYGANFKNANIDGVKLTEQQIKDAILPESFKQK